MAANVQSMCQYWKNFDLQDLQKHLDTTATDLANRQDESDISRKRLVEQSRDFKKNTPEEIRKVVGPLLRSFQAEVDALSKRSKAAEAAFLSVYKKLIDMPDPVPCLEHGIVLQKTAQRIESLELENKELLETLEDYNQDYPEAKIQEETIKELTAKLKDYDDQLESKTEARFKEKEKEIQKTFDKKERLLQETQLTLSNKLGEAEQKVSALHSALESAQAEIQRQKAKYDEVVEAKSSRSDAIKDTSSENLRSDEMEMVIKDLERANERAEASEREVEHLRQQLASATQNLHQVEQMEKATDMEQALDILKRSRLEVELAAKDKEITQLIEDIQRLQASYDSLQESTSARISRLEENINRKNKAFHLLEEMFRSQEEFEDIKRELSSIKSTKFSKVSDDDCPLETSNSLELLLLEKAKNEEQHQPAQPKQTSEAQPLNLTESDSTASNTNSTPPTTTTTTTTTTTNNNNNTSETFATMLGEELVTSYQQHNQSGSSTASTPTSNGLPPSSDNHPPPPSPHNHSSSSSSSSSNNNSNSTTNHVPFSPNSTNCQMPPPPTSQFLSYGNGHSPATHHYMPQAVVVKQEPNSGTTTPSNGKNQSLDTALVAKMVRELLSVHNIGQRLFAKHILGLSQGTVSELLSKPKSWDKLTEKGRESYRKMHAWAVDESNILALKAISPKKTIKKQPSDGVLKEPYTKPAGSQALVPSSQREDSATEERITQILNAAQQAMQMKKSIDHTKNFTGIQRSANRRSSPPIAHDLSTNMSHQLQVSTSMALNTFKEHSKNSVSSSKASVSTTNGTSTVVSSTGRSSPSHANMNSSSRNRSESSSSSSERKHGHKNLSSQNASSKERELAAKEMVTRIYREELTKLAQAAESAGNVAASTMYQQELARIAQNIHRSTPMQQQQQQQLHDSYHHQDNISIKTEPPDSTSDENSLQANGPIDLSKPHSSPQTPTTETTFADSGRHTGSAFCLVRPRLNGQDNYESSRFSSYLPSDCLSPLQRMQNIANSLTTRSHIGTPSTKPLKAVLPPITQEQFDKYSNIDTDILVKQVKETLSQYSISQRLFGENVLGLSQGSVSDLLARPKPWHMLTQKGREPFIRMQIFLEDGEAIPKLVASQYRIPPDKLMRSNSQNQESSSSECLSDNQQCQVGPLQSPPLPAKLKTDPLWASSSSTTTTTTTSAISTTTTTTTTSTTSNNNNNSSNSMSSSGGTPSSTVVNSYPTSMFEIAAMTSEIDTLDVTSKVKEVLQFHNLGQRLFGEAVLGLSQGSVSELLSKPKPWQMLSIKGREPFIKMHIWLADPHNIERLKCYQNELKDIMDYNSVDWFELLPAASVGHCTARRRRSSIDDRCFDAPTAPKRPRIFFTEEQKEILRQAYAQDPYPNQNTIEGLAAELNVGVKTVINWFHNHRMRAKQQQHPVSGNNSNSNSQGDGQFSVKTEPNEDSSNHSESSIISETTPDRSGDGGQWMFPKFEPVQRKASTDNSVEAEESNFEKKEQCSKDETSQDSVSRNNNNNNNNKVNTASMQSANTSVVNKRKRANPQWVFEGTQLDKTHSQENMSAKDDNKLNNAESSKDLEDENNDREDCELSKFSDRISKIQKLQKRISSADEEWEEFDRSASIEKIQKNLTASQEETWEF